LWPIDPKTNRRIDPWQKEDSIILVDENKTVFQFVTTTEGGRAALEKLCAAYDSDDNQGLFPVVRLGVGRRETQRGPIDYPILETVDWSDPEIFSSIIDAALSGQGELEDEEVPRIAARPRPDITDDDIPF
jgi:hypothetical protein